MGKPSRPLGASSGPFKNARAFFVTSVTWERRKLFQSERMSRLFLETLYAYRGRTSFLLHEFALMPDHFHLLLSVPTGTTLEKIVQFVKGGFSYQARKELRFTSEIRQRGFADEYILTGHDFEIKKRYIRENPVAAGLVDCEDKYPYSLPRTARLKACPFAGDMDLSFRCGRARIYPCAM